MALIIHHGYPNDIPDGLLFLPDDDAVREAAAVLTSRRGAILGPATFTPYTFLSDLAGNLDLKPSISEIERIFLVKRLMSEIPELADGARFAGLLSSLAKLIKELRRAYILNGNKLLSKLERPQNKHRILAELLDRYSKELNKLGKSDEPKRAFDAIEYLFKNGLPKKLDGFQSASALWFDKIERVQADFFAALSKHKDIAFYLPASEGSPAGDKHIAAANAVEKMLSESAERFDVGAHLRVRPAEGQTHRSAPTPVVEELVSAIANRGGHIGSIPESSFSNWPRIAVLSGRNAVKEAELVASAAKSLHLDNGVPLREITIFADSRSFSDIRRALNEHGLPFEDSRFPSLAETMIGELVRRLIELVRSRFGSRELFALLSHPLMGIDDTSDLETAASEAGIIGGLPLETVWLSPLERCEHPSAKELADIISKIADAFKPIGTGHCEKRSDEAISTKKQDCSASFAMTPFDGKSISGQEFSNCLQQFLKEFDILSSITGLQLDSTYSEFQIEAYNKVTEFVESFAGAIRELPLSDSFIGHGDIFLSLLRSEFIESRGGEGLRLNDFSSLHRLKPRVAIITGAVQGKLPPAEPDYPFLNRHDTETLGIRLPGYAYRWDFHLLSLIERAELVILTHPLAEEDRPLPPAPILVSLEPALGDGWKLYEDSMAKLADDLLSRPFSLRRRQIIAGEILEKPFADAESELEKLAELPALKHSAHALNVLKVQREVPPGAYDGVIGERFSAQIWERIEGTSGLGVSKIDRCRQCPFAFFMENVLQICGPPEPAEKLEPIDAGSILHKTLEIFWRKRIEKAFGAADDLGKRLDTLRKDYDSIAEIIALTPDNIEIARNEIADCIESAIDESSPFWPDALAEKSFVETIKKSLNVYLAKVVESKKDAFIPIATERPCSIEIANCQISGKIDRIDADAAGHLRIVDYKLSNCPSESAVVNGEALQMPLYLISISKLGEVVGSEYWHNFKGQNPKTGGRFEREDFKNRYNRNAVPVEEWPEKLDGHLGIAEKIIEDIRAGHFPPEPVAGKCQHYCGFSNICGFDPMRSK